MKKMTGTTIPKYAREKPSDCPSCACWNVKKNICCFGGLVNCYYLMSPPPRKQSPCVTCPYSKGESCVLACCFRKYHVRKNGGE